MKRKIIPAILLAVLLACGVLSVGEPAGGESLGSGTEPQGGPVYRDEAVTVTVDSITTDGKTVRAGFLVECAENRACVITTNIPEDWMTSIDVIEALRAVKRAEHPV